MNKELKDNRAAGKEVWNALLAQMAEGSGFLSAMFTSFRIFLKRQLLYLLLFGILGAVAASAFWYFKPRIYQAEMTVSYVHYEKKIYADMLEKLDLLIDSKSYASLEKILSLPAETVRSLHEIKGFNIRKEELGEDLSTQKVPFYIRVRVTDVSILPQLDPALVNYLDNTEFIQTRLEYMRQKSEDELVFLENRLTVIDSLSRQLVMQNSKLENEKTVTRMDLLEETLAVYAKIQEVRGSLVFNQNIEVLDGFIANERPVGKNAFYWMVYGFLAGILFWLVVLLLR